MTRSVWLVRVRLAGSLLLVAAGIAGCSSTPAATTLPAATDAPSSTTAANTTPSSTTSGAVSTTAATTTLPQSTTTVPTTSTAVPDPIRTIFLQITDDAGPGLVEASYPHLVHPDAATAAIVNDQIDAALEAIIKTFQEGAASEEPGEVPSTLVIQAAPELLNNDVFSISGITTEVFGTSGTGSTGRLGWVFALSDGSPLQAANFFKGGDLRRLAASARHHLVTDVLGSESAITVPAGLNATSGNFDAVWLTATGIGVGFDQYQVAAAEAGNPAVLIPFTELRDGIDTTGVLAALQAGDTLPEL